jgi:hypothetical protein
MVQMSDNGEIVESVNNEQVVDWEERYRQLEINHYTQLRGYAQNMQRAAEIAQKQSKADANHITVRYRCEGESIAYRTIAMMIQHDIDQLQCGKPPTGSSLHITTYKSVLEMEKQVNGR